MDTFTFNINEIGNTLWSLAAPVITVIVGWFLTMAKKYVKRIADSIEAKNDIDSLKQTNEIKNMLLSEIDSMVKSAVGANMQNAKWMKENNPDGRLTDEQAEEINNTVYELVMFGLPESLTSKDGTLNHIIGGTDRLDSIINSMIEKYVYEYKQNDNGKIIAAQVVENLAPVPTEDPEDQILTTVMNTYDQLNGEETTDKKKSSKRRGLPNNSFIDYYTKQR